MKTVAIKNNHTGVIKMGNAITGKDCMNHGFYMVNDKSFPIQSVYKIEDKPMSEIWYDLIQKLDEQIAKVEINKDGRLKQLYRKRELLQDAMGRCK